MSVSVRTSRQSRFVLTGPTGWIGRALLALMHREGDVDALAQGDAISLFGSRSGTIRIANGTDLPIHALSDIGPNDVADAHVIHLAYLTKDKVAELGEEVFRRVNGAIDDALLSAISSAAPASLFVASSGAARLVESGHDRHPYGCTKLEQEARFLGWARDAGIPALCGRIFNLAGPHINKLEAYAVSNFALQALRDRRIVITAEEPVFRTFLHVDDLCRIIIRAARQGVGAKCPLDLCGTQLLEMQDIAKLVSCEMDESIIVERPKISFGSRSEYLGSAQESYEIAMRLSIELIDAQIQVRDTVNWIRQLEASPSRAGL